jgi:hypothetical protein
MGQGDLPTPRGGPLRRRREKRQLEQLAEASEHHDALKPTMAHVRIVEDQALSSTEDQAAAGPRDVERQEPDSPMDGAPQNPRLGFHVRAVPIDQPIDE